MSFNLIERVLESAGGVYRDELGAVVDDALVTVLLRPLPQMYEEGFAHEARRRHQHRLYQREVHVPLHRHAYQHTQRRLGSRRQKTRYYKLDRRICSSPCRAGREILCACVVCLHRF